MGKHLISILFLVLCVAFVSAEMIANSPDGYNHNVKVYVEQGWNLVLLVDLEDILETSEIKQEDILTTWVYSAEEKKYLQFYPNRSDIDFYYSKDRVSEYSDAMGRISLSSMWVYSKKAGYLEYYRVDVPKIDNITLLQGWNFLTITPEMVGKNLNELKSGCNVEKAFLFKNQKWNALGSKTFDLASTGTGFIVKVSSDCTMSSDVQEINSSEMILN